MATFKSVRDIFDDDPVGNSTIVVQGISGDEYENLLYYLEVICKNKTIKDVFVPSRNGGVALAVLEEKFTVESIREWQERASNKKFEGVVLTLKMLGEPKGIYLELPKDTAISEEFLSLYFESRKSGGIEESVIDAKLSSSANKLHAVVHISSNDAVKSILRKSDHKLKGEDVALQPYYPEVHDHIIKASIKESQPRETSSVQVPSVNENMQKEQLSKLEISAPSKAVIPRQYVRFPPPVRPLHIHPQPVLHSSTPTSNNSAPSSNNYTPSSSIGTYDTLGSAQPSYSSNLMVLCDDPELQTNTFSAEAGTRHHVSPFLQRNSRTPLHASNEACNWKDPQRVVAVKPVQRKTERQLSTGSIEGDKQNCKPRSRGRGKYYKQEEDDDNLSSFVEVILPSVKIVMLKICHIQDKYQEKYRTDSLKFVLNERTGKVIIRSSTDAEAVQAKLYMYECLSGLLMKEESLTQSRLALLKREQSKICLRNICKKQKVRASFVVNEASKSIEWYGFAQGDIELGVKLLQNEINVQQIQLRQGQERSVNGDAWNSLTQRLSVGTTCIFVDEKSKTISIESFFGPKVKEVRSKIIDFLKENVPKKSASVTLEGAKARCFQTRMGDKMKREAVKHNGKLDIKEVIRSPLKLEIVVEGDESLTDELSRLVGQIWHESIDFDKLSSKAMDKWLMLRGLGSKAGPTFFRNFEDQHNCFIEVSKKGEFSIPKPRVTVHDVVNKENFNERTEQSNFGLESDDGESAESFSRGENDEDIEEEDNDFDQYKQLDKDVASSESDMPEKWAIRHFEREQEFLLQGAMNEEDAIKLAIANSLKDQNPYIEELKAFEDRYVPRNVDQYRPVRLSPRRQFTNQFPEDSDSDDGHQSVLKTNSVQIGHINVTLKQGVLVKQKADVLVNVVSPTGSITESVVSKSFLQSGGSSLKQLYEAALANNGGDATMIRTGPSGRLQCQAVLHVKLHPGPQICQQILSQVLPEILNNCRGCASLALPPLGVGRMYKYPAADVAQCILQEVSMYQRRGLKNSLRQITVVIFKDDHKTYQDFDDALSSFNTSGTPRTLYAPQYRVPNVNQAQRYAPVASVNAFGLRSNVSSANAPHQFFPQRSNSLSNLWDLPKASSSPTFQGQDQRTGPSCTPGGLQHIQTSPGAIASPVSSARYGNQQVSNQVPRKHHSRSSSADRHPSRSGRGYHHRGRSGYHARTRDSVERDSSHGKSEEAMHSTRHTSSNSKRNRKSRFPDDEPADDLKVKVIADNKDMCVKARNLLGKEIKMEFLYEEKLQKSQKISSETKRKIIDVIVKHRIKSLKDKDGYILKGNKENVKDAHREILQILLNEKGNHQMRRRKRATVKRGTTEFAKMMCEDDLDIPSYWDMYREEFSLKDILTSWKDRLLGKKYTKVRLEQDSRPYSAIIKMINANFDPSKIGQGQDAAGLDRCKYSKLFVLQIDRIENPELFEKFAVQKQALFRRLFWARGGSYPEISKLPDCSGAVKTEGFVRSALDKDVHQELNEVFLFHGTKKENVKVICNSGFDQRLGSGKAMFGPGIYGAECSMKADQYTDDKAQRTSGQGHKKKMFLMRMLLGNAFLCSEQNPHKFRRPPCTRCLMDDCTKSSHARKFGHLFDSIVGDNKKLFREFVVYDSTLCYPEYLITYERR